MTKDLRQAVRYDVEVAAEVYTKSAVLPAQTRNLSNTGVCLDVEVELPERTAVGVSLFLVTDGIEDPDAKPLNIKADIIWSSPRDAGGFSSGMRFDSSNEAAVKAIADFLAQLS
ncbi:MAG: PilZ domain-containing protein [Deltaproteobacteria bacterium]|nr:PilZ domain-containing protein [Deltaproteobacteria bacterium]MBN2673490.1 PilZ domain-containing protein [Deltaproteobacteria bacterium]